MNRLLSRSLAQLALVLAWLCLILPLASAAQAPKTWPDIASIPPDLVVPTVRAETPAPGRRVWCQTPDWQATAVRYAIYLPPDWTPSARLPVLVEWPGNGPYRNAYGDTCDGSVEGCQLGYGISGGQGFIWVCLPFVEKTATGTLQHTSRWWGDIAETKRHTQATVAEVCQRFGGDPDRVVLCGFSRGSIGCHYIGLHDDTIARLWRTIICHSHFDGVNESWPYPAADRASAQQRLQRLAGRPLWISHEGSGIHLIADYLRRIGQPDLATLVPLPFRNHTDSWVLRPIPERERLRTWLAAALRSTANPYKVMPPEKREALWSQ